MLAETDNGTQITGTGDKMGQYMKYFASAALGLLVSGAAFGQDFDVDASIS